ncbi:hypothetical protein Tco_0126637 [Tanacetum coccineum]
MAESHREEEDQEGNNSPEIETLPLFPIHGGSQHDFFSLKASDLSSDHSMGENHREEEDQEGNNSLKIETLPLFPIHGGSQHDLFSVKASDLSLDHNVGGYYTARMVGPHMDITADFIENNRLSVEAMRVTPDSSRDTRPQPRHPTTAETTDLIIHNTTQPHMRSDMTTCLNDLSYIPLNKEQNEPTQGDIVANEELYPGCDYVTRLDFMAKFTYFKVKGKLTDSIFNEMLEFFQNVFPTTKGYKLPPSYYAIKKTFKTIRLGWKDSNTPGNKVPKNVLCYFSIIPRLQRLYKSSHTAKEMTWHATRKCTKPVLQHVASDTDNIQSASVVMYEKEFFHADVDDPDIIHVDKSSDLALTTTLNDLEIAALHINGKSIDVDAPPYIIDVDEDDDIIDDEDVLPHDLADSNDEDLVNVDDDDGVAMLADVARGHKGDGGGDDRPPTHESAGGYRGKGIQKPNLGDCEGVPDALWFLRRQSRQDGKAEMSRKIGAQFDLQPHMQSELWPDIRKGIDQHLGKIYTDNKSSLKRDYWVKNPDDETYDGSRTLAALRDMQESDEAKGIGHLHDDQIMAMFVGASSAGTFPVFIDLGFGELFTQLQSQHESGSGSGCGASEDDESGDDEDADS